MKLFLKKVFYSFLGFLKINQIPLNCINKVIFPHPIGVVVSPKVKFGKNCIVYQGVTIGSKSKDIKEYPVLGNNVIVYANACVIGSIVLGDNVVVGAGSVVTKSFPMNSVVCGNPARVVK